MSSSPLRIAVAATPSVAIPSLSWLHQSSEKLALIITQPDRPAGRGRTIKSSLVAQWAEDQGLPVYKPENSQEMAEVLTDIDLLITIGYGRLLPSQILKLPQFGALNLHFSLLPRWRGAAPVQRAIEAGDSVSGVTVFALDEGMDTGPIYSVKRFALDSDITSDELLSELSLLGVEALAESLAMIKSGKLPIPQSSVGITRAHKISKDECKVDWSAGAAEISARVRAFTSIPGAWTVFKGSVVKIDSITLSELILEPGEISILNHHVYVGTGTSSIEIGFVTPAGKSRMTAISWVNGARLVAGDCLG